MAKPIWREHDSHPKRGDDMRIKALGVEIEASGRTVVFVIVAIVLGMLSVGGFYLANEGLVKHDTRTAVDHQALLSSVDRMVDTVETMTCVLTLNDKERVEFRENGRYCTSYNQQQQRREMRRQESFR